MAYYQGRTAESILFLSRSGTPVTGILFSDLTVQTRAAEETEFTAKIMTSVDWVEIGSGFYALQWSTDDMSALGKFLFTVASARFDNFSYAVFDIDPVPLPFLVPPDVCIVSGNITDLGGKPSHGNIITAHAPAFPVAAGQSLVSSDYIKTVPDYLGNFQIPLIQGKIVVVQIDRTGAKYQIVVPLQSSANFLDLIPPVPN